MRIGQLARCGGVSVQTLRYYEREGVLRKATRTVSGYRAYTAADVEHVLFVKRCQKAGFSLQDIKQLSALHGLAAAPPPSAAVKRQIFIQVARKRLQELEQKIGALQDLRRQVGALLDHAEQQKTPGCPMAAV